MFETIYHFVLDFSNNDHPFTTDRNFASCLLRIARDVFRSLGDILLHLEIRNFETIPEISESRPESADSYRKEISEDQLELDELKGDQRESAKASEKIRCQKSVIALHILRALISLEQQ